MSVAPATFAHTVLSSTARDFQEAQQRIRGCALFSPLLDFTGDTGHSIQLKAENLQPLGSFKVRCGANVLGTLSDEQLQAGVATVSAGNFAQGLALAAKRRGIRVTAHVPENAARVKIDALRNLDVNVVHHSASEWWTIAATRNTGAEDGVFIHPVCDAAVVHGNGTIGLEIAEQRPDMDTVIVPFGGGGLIAGIALALRAIGKRVRIVACEVEGAAALQAARSAGKPVTIERRPSFVDGIGSNRVLDEMWPVLSALVDDVIVVSAADARAAVRRLATTHRLIVEGAAGAALAAATSPRCGGTNVVAILSGGNIDNATFCDILNEPV
jgi:threonine dehydratase